MSVSESERHTNPFPGLRPFLESEQHLFFGRESQIDAMVDKLAANRFLAVVGTSGSGKSSLVNCGLRPALRTGLMANAGTAWRMAQCRPGGDPVAALSTALAEDGVLFTNYQDEGMPLREIIDTTLRMGKLGLVDMVEQAQLSEGCNLLLVVDQFEELFRYQYLHEYGEDKSNQFGQQAAVFVNLLLAAIEQSALPVYVVITMRSDFLGDCAQFPGLAEAINNGQYLVPRMTREQRRAAIAGPVGVGGGKIYPPLLTRLVNDVGTNPDQLSILQHALNRTWSFWEDQLGRQGMLDIECYESIGSMTRALDQHADKAYAELDTKKKNDICETVFKTLTDKASDGRGVRRPTRLETLCEMCNATQEEVVAVIDVFRKASRSFLMPPEGVELHPDTVIDISHESLMRVWKRLDRWADDEAETARMYQRLAETSELYKDESAGLLRDPDLRVAIKWREKNKPNATWAKQYNPDFDSAMSFLKQSERSDKMRKRLWGGSIAAAFALFSGYLAYASYDKISELSEQKQQALNELDEAEQEKIYALNQVAQAEYEASDQVEESNQKVVFDIEENLTRILTEEAEVTQQGSLARDSDLPNNTVVAREQIQFFDAIVSLTETEREIIVERIADLEASQNSLKAEKSEKLSQYQKLKVQIQIQCELNSAGEQYEQPLRNTQTEHCNQSVTDDPIELGLNNNNDDNVQVDCTQNFISESILGKLETTERKLVEEQISQLACDVAATREKITELDYASANLQKVIDHLRGKSGTTIQAALTATEVVEVASSENDYLKQFLVCETVENLEPSGCKAENEWFSPGRVYIFARVVTQTNDERITLKWFKDNSEQSFSEKQFTVQSNPEGYRAYTWKNLDRGAYRACLFSQSGQEIDCTQVNIDQSNVVIAESEDEQVTVDTVPNESVDTSSNELTVASALVVQEDTTQELIVSQEATRLEDSENDGFLVCNDVVKLEPVECSQELNPGRVYAFARVVTAHDIESLTLQWFREGVELPGLRKELEIRKNSSGYRTYTWNTFDSGSYSVSLTDQEGEELRAISFNVK